MSSQRQDEVASWVEAAGRVALGDLAARFGVSEMTMRRDLDALTLAGRLQRVRGGAERVTSPGSAPRGSTAGLASARRGAGAGVGAGLGAGLDTGRRADPGAGTTAGSDVGTDVGSRGPDGGDAGHPSPSPATVQDDPATPGAVITVSGVSGGPDPSSSPEGHPGAAPAAPQDSVDPEDPEGPWQRAAAAALADLGPGTAVLLTGGPGAPALARTLAAAAATAPLTVAVTALEPATVLAGSPGVRLVVLGGEADVPGSGSADLVGPAALAALEDLHLDLALLTPSGLDARGVWAPTSGAAALVAAAVARASRAVAVVGSDALGRPGLVRAVPLSALTQVLAAGGTGDATETGARLDAVRAATPSAPAMLLR